MGGGAKEVEHIYTTMTQKRRAKNGTDPELHFAFQEHGGGHLQRVLLAAERAAARAHFDALFAGGARGDLQNQPHAAHRRGVSAGQSLGPKGNRRQRLT